MRPVVLFLTLAAALVIGAVLYFLWPGLSHGTLSAGMPDPAVGYCLTNDEIAADERATIEQNAAHFLDVFEVNPEDAFDLMSNVGKAGIERNVTLTGAANILRQHERVAPRQVRDTYLLRFSSPSPKSAHVPCEMKAGSAVYVARGMTFNSAVAMFTQETAGHSALTYTVWLEKQGRAWLVRAVHFTPSTINGQDSRDLLLAAREQRERGNVVNATMLYVAVRETIGRADFVRERLLVEFQNDMQDFASWPLIRGEPPYTWTFGDATFQVHQVNYHSGTDGTTTLVINHTLDAAANFADAETINRDLITRFDAKYPEWRETFQSLAARSNMPASENYWATLFDRETGFEVVAENTPVDEVLQAPAAP